MSYILRQVLLVGFVCVAMTAVDAQQAPPAPAPPATPAPATGQPPQPQPATAPPAAAPDAQQPTFRTGATFVRVDAYVTGKDGTPVPDLKADDFIVKEDGVPQKVSSFEYVHIPNAALQTGERRDPTGIDASREAVTDPRKRVFVLFLDTNHVTQGLVMRVRPALLKFLQRIVGPDDLIAAMTPDMEPDAIAFGSRTETLEGALNALWGRRGSVVDTPEEQAIQDRYTPDTWPAARERRRAKLSMDAMEGLVRHLGALREERKAIITVSEGWQLEPVNLKSAADPQNPNRPPTGPTVGVGPDGRLGTNARQNGGLNGGECDTVRMEIAGMDTVQQFRDLPNEANRANATFYTVDPRGLAAFDAELGPERSVSIVQDAANLRSKLNMLRELAERTDGLAAVDSNDLDKQLRRIADDVSSYYLLGYDSTNPKLDGKYRTINVRVAKPGMQVRARRGYRAVTTETETSAAGTPSAGGKGKGGAAAQSGNGNGGSASSAGGGSSASGAANATGANSRARAAAMTPEERMAADIASAVGGLTSTRNDTALRTRVIPRASAAAPAGAAATAAADGGSELQIVSELNATLAKSDAWLQGGVARVFVRSTTAGQDLALGEATLAPGARVLLATVPLKAALAPGEYRVLLRLTAQSKVDAVSDTIPLVIASTAHLPMPTVLRRGPSTGIAYTPTADLRFTRQERVRLEWPETAAPDALDVTIVNQRGDIIKLPVQVSARDDNGMRVSVVDFAFAPLAPGGYALIAREKAQTAGSSTIVPVQVIP